MTHFEYVIIVTKSLKLLDLYTENLTNWKGINMNTKIIGDKLRDSREKKWMKKTEMAKLLECSDSTINNYENGDGIKSFDNLIKMATAYDLDLKDIFGIDYVKNINSGEHLLDSATRGLMGRNIAKYNNNKRFINSNENKASIFYNTLIGNITDGIMKDILEYMIYPSKSNINIADEKFINDNECDPIYPNKFYEEETEQTLELKATLSFQKLMKQIRNSKEIIKWIEYFEKEQQEWENSMLSDSVEITDEEYAQQYKELHDSYTLIDGVYYGDTTNPDQDIIDKNKAKITDYRNKIRDIKEKRSTQKETLKE